VKRWLALGAITFAACFNPQFDSPTCGPNGECPSGFTCEQTVCRELVTDIDAPMLGDATDGPIDSPIDAPSDGVTDAPPNDGVLQCLAGEIQSPFDPHRCFVKTPALQPWPGAQNTCVTMGGELADILNTAENQAIQPFYQGENQGVWLGGSDQQLEMNWMWLNGAPFSFQMWGVGEPNDQPIPADCLRISSTGEWFDSNCNDTHRAVCVRRI
jgi:hypothetical protein